MSVWKWKALDNQGRVIRGTCEENDANNVCKDLRKQHLYPLKIKPSLFTCFHRLYKRKANKLYWSRLARKIAVLYDAGVPLINIFKVFAQSERDKKKRKQWQESVLLIESGEDLSDVLAYALQPPPDFFFRAMIKAGENSGTLSASFWELAETLQAEHYFLQKVRKALFYPFLLLCIALLVIYVLSIIVLPMYKSLFNSMDTELPVITRFLFYAGEYIPLLLGLGLFVSFLCNIYLRVVYKEKGLGIVQKLPLIGSLHRTKELIQFNGIISRLLTAGISLSDSLKLSERLVEGRDTKKLAADLEFAVSQGRRICPVIRLSEMYPPEALEIIDIGEESGNLSAMFGHVSKMMQRELEERLERLTQILEPALVIFMAGVVGLVAIGVLLPIFEAGTLFNS